MAITSEAGESILQGHRVQHQHESILFLYSRSVCMGLKNFRKKNLQMPAQKNELV